MLQKLDFIVTLTIRSKELENGLTHMLQLDVNLLYVYNLQVPTTTVIELHCGTLSVALAAIACESDVTYTPTSPASWGR
ncbi:hypothetical protein TNCV_2439091 [Trichonephila clavipes]|nr:hypothetical protein TNCV_2439091 [Trichonephila clavipes]